MFDGDGMVLSFAFDNGRCFFRNKFVRTKGFMDEQARLLLAHAHGFGIEDMLLCSSQQEERGSVLRHWKPPPSNTLLL